ncbi:MAG TPA: TauD/TfdA family dioxygenase [Candidatus Sulfotelmatobacter sp.]|nr:TauD/TfdA family dioxygenase [Candidatus Sulfotelmatobacter sp.]
MATVTTAALALRPLSPALGTEVLGLDLSHPLDDATLAWVERAFADHPVLVFRNQSLSAAQLAAFGARFGTPRPHTLASYRYPGCPEVSWLRNVDEAGKIDWYGVKRATDWHTDSTFEETLPRLAMLHALEVPSEKGGTVFADMRAAYDTLSDAMKQRLATLTGLHGRTDGPAGVKLYTPEEGKMAEKRHPERHRPAVLPHPVTGRPVLFVNPMHTHGFDGMERDAAWRLIEELADHATQDRFVYYHAWHVGDLVMWDEQATMHRGAGDSRPDERRVMLRTIVYPN